MPHNIVSSLAKRKRSSAYLLIK